MNYFTIFFNIYFIYYRIKTINQIMNNMIDVIELGRQTREKNKIATKKPVAYMEVINFDKEYCDNLKTVETYIIDELNANEILYNQDESKFIKVSAKPNFDILLLFLEP